MKNRVLFVIMLVLWISTAVMWSVQKAHYERQLQKVYTLALECIQQRDDAIDAARECLEEKGTDSFPLRSQRMEVGYRGKGR
jgi:hypothetical protein